jgi:hypothetical protein
MIPKSGYRFSEKIMLHLDAAELSVVNCPGLARSATNFHPGRNSANGSSTVRLR